MVHVPDATAGGVLRSKRRVTARPISWGNRYSFREWLTEYGALKCTVPQSIVIDKSRCGCYSSMFCQRELAVASRGGVNTTIPTVDAYAPSGPMAFLFDALSRSNSKSTPALCLKPLCLDRSLMLGIYLPYFTRSFL